MMRRIATLLLAVAALMPGSGVRSFAHEGHDHKIMGTVTMATADHIMLKDKDGKDVTVKVTKETRIRSKPTLAIDQIRPGTRVVITATQAKDQSFTAKTIEVGAVAATAK